MQVRFNGGRGAILCENCSKIIYTFRNMPDYIAKELERVQKDDNLAYEDINPIFCSETCENTFRRI